MSTVYLAVQLDANRVVALKVMAPALNADPIFGERFQREAKIVSQLAHPNIIAIHHVGQHETTNYIAMDYMELGSVATKIKEGMTAKLALQVIRQISLALNHAHENGYIHRDIKPENILLGKDGLAVLSDFGVARSVSSNTQMTNAGTVLGTPNYMSPEQARGKDLDGRSDIYSLGIVLYEMLVGTPPYHGSEAMAIAIQHLTAPIPKLPPKFSVLQPLINKMVAKKPQDRFQSGAEVATAIEQIMERLQGPAGSEELRLPKHKAKARNGLSKWFATLFAKKQPTEVDLSDLPLLRSEFEEESGKTKRRALSLFLFTLIFVIAATATSYWYWQTYKFKTIPGDSITQPQPTETEQLTPIPDAPPIELASEVSQGEIDRPVEEEPTAVVEEPPPEPEIPTYPLTINVTPKQLSYVRVMNIVDKYRPGIKLPAGEYHVIVGAPGYWQQEHWVTVDNQPVTLDITLEIASHPGDILQDEPVPGVLGPEMVVISPGTFIMGDLRYSDSQPRHEVIIEKPFAISVHEVRFAEYDAYCITNGIPLLPDEDWGRNTRPVINMTWSEARDYAQWLAQTTGKPYRLPTESEWEYIASSGGLQEYPWSGHAEDGQEMANCRGGCRSEYVTLFVSKTAPVKKFSANTFGVYDLAGNVAEWTSTCYQRTYDPIQNSNASDCDRVVRGGSFLDDIEDLNVFRREHYPETYRDKHVGFRVVLDLPAFSEE